MLAVEPLTPKQSEVLAFVRATIREKGVAPTLAELAAHFDISRVTAFEHLTHLQEKGHIRRRKFKSRAISVIDPTEEPLRAWVREAINHLTERGEREIANRGRRLLGESG